ncbi:hypothetical protein BGX33_010524 [Mortierella sp. NVP41]|nr:hypothetical protein BGX33_010524 [Mortierella sp. NVP41]
MLQLRHHKPARSSHSTSSASKNSKSSKGGKRNKRGDKNSDDENRAFAATLRNRKQNRALFSPPQKRAAVPAAPVHRNPAPAGRRARGGNTRSRSPPPPKKNTPLLLLPDSRSVWQAGTYQTVRWNRRYTKSLPADTTVDIVLIDSKTNRKVSSLKRFIPFRKGGSQVWVPAAIPEGVSFVLVLELYRGRSQQQVLGSTTTTTAATAAAGTVYRNRQQQGSSNSQAGSSSSNGDGSVAVQPTDVLSRIVRRSDISISAGIPYPPPPSNNGNYNGRNPTSPKSSSKGTHHDINHDDFYAGPSQERSMEFSPDELRQEYPSTLRPLVLEHTFGLHQKVYTLTPYTLAWKIPDRVAELLEYTRRAQTLFNTLAKNRALASSGSYPRSTFLAKVLVDLIKDDTTESVAVLAKDVPAETMFQYLSIQDRLPLAFYRIRVQLVVVEVETDLRAIVSGQPSPSPVSPSAKFAMEGWEFPEGAKVIDRYEAITRRFWVSQGAL